MLSTRPYEASTDRDEVVELFKAYPKIFNTEDLGRIERDLIENSSGYSGKFVAVDEDKIVGYIDAYKIDESKDVWSLRWFVVHKEDLKHGVGKVLFSLIKQYLESINIKKLYAYACSCGDLDPARRFLEKVGFKKVAQLPDYYQDGHHKLVYFQKLG